MFSWCFKCQNPEDDYEYHQRPKTRNNSNNNSQKSSNHAAVPPTDTTTTTIITSNKDVVESREKSVEEMQKECLEAHNSYRAKHGASPLTLNKQLNAYATEWAKKLSKSNTLQHRKNNKYGENLYLGTNNGPQTHELAVKAWYEENKDYNFNKPGFSSNTGHFTQVVWKSSKELGVGIVKKDNRTWVVCNYNPPGNMMGHYRENVAPLLDATAAKVIDKMKPQKLLLKRPSKPEIEDKDETVGTKKTYSAKDLKLWSQFELECLDSHNKYRAIHGSSAMKLNRKLCNLAQDWSKQLAKQRSLQHRPNNDYGENIYYAMNFEPSAEQCVKSWYDEIKNYNYAKPGFSSQTGHFTQVVWKESIELGVGITTSNNMTFVVCNYNPPGNVMGQYDEQVPKPGSKPATSINTRASVSVIKQPKIDEQQKQTFEEVCLDSHNSLRALHGSPAMSLNKNLNFFASDWAEYLAQNNKFENRSKNRFGENIFYTSDPQIEGQEPVVYWYNGIKDYDFEKPGYSPATAGFTQIIWKNSTQLGVGIAKFGYSTYVVCNYDPKGNILDKYSENVLPSIEVHDSDLPGKHLTFEVDSFENEMLKWHNYYRLRHNSPLLELSQELMDYSKNYANHLIDNKPFDEIPQYAVSTLSFSQNKPSAEEIVSNWYKEIEKYDFQNPQQHSATKHFTQIIWKNTKFMGVGECKRQANSIVVVCYEPSGNIEQQYAENVSPTI